MARKTPLRIKRMLHILLSIAFVVSLAGLVYSGSADIQGGHIKEAILDATDLTSRWAGIEGFASDTGIGTSRIHAVEEVIIGDVESGQVAYPVTLPGINDQEHYFAALPFENSTFNLSKLSSVSLSDLDSGGLFDSNEFPTFYPNYNANSDTPDETFETIDSVQIGGKDFTTARTTLRGSKIPYYLLKYETTSFGTQPMFFVPIDSYTGCYNNNDCEYSLMLPNLAGSNSGDRYYLYHLPENTPVELTAFIDGEEDREFEFPGRPYELNVTTKWLLNKSPVETQVGIFEQEGNNLFVPAIDPQNYVSESVGLRETKLSGGTAETRFLIAPTKLNSESYSLQIAAMGDNLTKRNFIDLSVKNNRIERINKNTDPFSSSYKQGVNRLRPIADCTFRYANDGELVEIAVSGSSSFETVRGVPYEMNVNDPSVSRIKLTENKSHTVLFPTLRSQSPWRTIHKLNEDKQKIVFVPTLSKGETYQMDALDSSNNTLYQANFSVKSSTCGDLSDGTVDSNADTTALKETVNNIRPVLDSMFAAES